MTSWFYVYLTSEKVVVLCVSDIGEGHGSICIWPYIRLWFYLYLTLNEVKIVFILTLRKAIVLFVSDLKEGHGGAPVDGAVLYLRLLGQVVGVLNGWRHPLHGEEGGQVSGVWRDHDEREEPPHGADHSCRHGSGGDLTACAHAHTHTHKHMNNQ